MNGEQRILSREECEAVFERARTLARGGGETAVRITSWWQGELRWGRNRVTLSSDRRNVRVVVTRMIPNGSFGSVVANQVGDAALEAAVRAAERLSGLGALPGRGIGFHPPMPHYERRMDYAIWSDATYGLTTEERGEIARSMIAAAEAKDMLSAGYIELRAASSASLSTGFPELRSGAYALWDQPYVRWTQAQCSMTVRDAKGTGSGWAGLASYDWRRIESAKVAGRATEKAIASRAPVALEPGRYTVILEPQAVADLMEILVRTLEHREVPEAGAPGPWLLGRDPLLGLWRSKLGMQVADERVTISHDPADSRLGIIMPHLERPGPVAWIARGVLTNLGHQFHTDIALLEGMHTLRGPTGYHMAGGEASLEEMIQTTRRGLLVTRLVQLRELDPVSLLATGLTRDGLWLIEDGRITKAVKNFRFTDSPLRALNSIEQLGEPVPVFRPTKEEGGQLTPAIVPALKVRDFSFTSLVDAV